MGDHAFDHTVPALFFPGVVLPALTFLGLYAYPFVEKRLTGDVDEHELLERPSQRPGRVAFGAGAFTFYLVLLLAGSDDVIASWLGLTVERIVVVLRVCLLVLPVVVGLVARRWARDLASVEE